MPELKSLSLFVGTADCNANCSHCAGRIHRAFAPKEDGEVNEELMQKTLRDCFAQGARRLSLSSSGEPTLSPKSVTRTLEIVQSLRSQGVEYPQIHLYSNGIRIGEDEKFCHDYLRLWKSLSLSTVYITVHDTDESKNAQVYNIPSYPSLPLIFNRIHKSGLTSRANLVLSKQTIGTLEKFIHTIAQLRIIGADSVTSWSIRDYDDQFDEKHSPPIEVLDKIESWITENQDPDFKVRIYRESNKSVYEKREKLTLFPNGVLSNSWCN